MSKIESSAISCSFTTASRMQPMISSISRSRRWTRYTSCTSTTFSSVFSVSTENTAPQYRRSAGWLS